MGPDGSMPNSPVGKSKDSLNVEFVQASESDWESFRDIRLKALLTDPEAFGGTYEKYSKLSQQDWESILSDPNSEWFAAKEGAKFVAMAGVYYPREENLPHHAFIKAVYSDPDYRGKGIGESLLKDIIEKLKVDPNITNVQLGVRGSQQEAIKMYHNLGFSILDVYKNSVRINGQDQDGLKMELVFGKKPQR